MNIQQSKPSRAVFGFLGAPAIVEAPRFSLRQWIMAQGSPRPTARVASEHPMFGEALKAFEGIHTGPWVVRVDMVNLSNGRVVMRKGWW